MGGFASGKSRIVVWGELLASQIHRLPLRRSTWLVAGLTFLLGFLPVLSRPGYESALLFGLIVPSITAVAAALCTRHRACESAEQQLYAAMRLALAHATTLVAVLSIHALHAGWCAPAHDLTLLLLGPVSGIIMGGFWGCATGIFCGAFAQCRATGWVTALAILGPLTSIVIGIAKFYFSPVVFAFDPFVGFFAGSPYDTGFDPTARLISYRAGSIGLWIFLWAIARHIGIRPNGSLALTRVFVGHSGVPARCSARADAAACVLGFLGLCLFVAITLLGESLGHRSSTAFVRQSLGQSTLLERCEIVHGVANKQRQIQRLATDCNAWLTRLERRLGVGQLDRVTVYVFDSVEQKELLMGAAHTQIAKPWRREIYLNGANYPDDVVGHELAHVVAGLAARGPFKIAGRFAGWLPNPGLIEGMAVALAPDEDGDLTELEWSAALAQIGKLPTLGPLFSLGFLGHSGALAYTVAGAFVDWLGQTYGKRVVRLWYGGVPIEQVSGRSLENLEREFIARLAEVRLPAGAMDAAKAKFARLGVYARHCPHAVDRAIGEADQRLAAGDAAEACRRYSAARRLDASEIRARFGLGECAERSATNLVQAEPAMRVYRELAEDALQPLAVRQRAIEKQADLRMRLGAVEEAQSLYANLLSQIFDVDRRRSLEVRLAAKDDQAMRAVRALLLGVDGEVAWDLAVRELLRWSEASPNDGLADYLLGRNYWLKGRESAASEHLDVAIQRGIASADIFAEALRQRAILACAVGDAPKAVALADRLSRESNLPTPRRLGVLRLVERCGKRLAGDDWPEFAGAVSAPIVASASNGSDARRGAVHRDPTLSANASKSAPDQQKKLYDSDSFSCPTGMQTIRGGEFSVGSKRGTQSPDENPRFITRLRGFCMDRTEVTVDAYAQCVKAGICSAAIGPSSSCNARHHDRGNHPINCVSHGQATTYCTGQSARLPTEFEWEYAARGGSQALKYPWGEGSPDGRACWKTNQSCKVMTFEPGAFGLYDMSGNVWEWTSSSYGEYPWGTPYAGELATMVYRGGGWSRRFEKWMHVGLRNRLVPWEKGAHLGFRCAKEAVELTCPFESNPDGSCAMGVLDAECPRGQVWNGHRCARSGEPSCPAGFHVDAGRGCLRDVPLVIKNATLPLEGVQRRRSPEFDADCRRNQPARPNAQRYSGGSHEARNLAARRAGCKNRDVGVGWNSVCCP